MVYLHTPGALIHLAGQTIVCYVQREVCIDQANFHKKPASRRLGVVLRKGHALNLAVANSLLW
jgi:hypothetical protein